MHKINQRPMQEAAERAGITPPHKQALTKAELIQTIVPDLEELACDPDGVSREKTASTIIDKVTKSLLSFGFTEVNWRNGLSTTLNMNDLKEAGYKVPPRYQTCSTCGHSGDDVICNYYHVGGQLDLELICRCINTEACEGRQVLKTTKGRD